MIVKIKPSKTAKNDLTKFLASTRQVAWSLHQAINATTTDVISDLKMEMASKFESYTAYTKNSLARKQSPNKNELRAVVFIKGALGHPQGGGGTPAAHYLAPEVEGGARIMKRFEFALHKLGIFRLGEDYVLPARGYRSKILKRVTILKIIKDLKAQKQFEAKGVKSKRFGALRGDYEYFSQKAGKGYIIFKKSNLQTVSELGSGMKNPKHKRSKARLAKHANKRRSKAIAFVTPVAPRYKKLYRFWEVGYASAEKNLPKHFEKFLDENVKRRLDR